jgi:hypothetical protein
MGKILTILSMIMTAIIAIAVTVLTDNFSGYVAMVEIIGCLIMMLSISIIIFRKKKKG